MNRIKIILVMIIWGSLGAFTRNIPLSALTLAFLRALIALPVLYAVLRIKNVKKVRPSQLKPYIISGVLLGFGWLTLFYGFKNTSLSSAVIIYNMCPVYVIIAAPIVLKEKITKTQIAVISVSFLGLFFIVGSSILGSYGYLGLMLSAVSGMLYAIIVLINRSIKNRVDNNLATFVQILTSVLVLLPFVCVESDIAAVLTLDTISIINVILLGVLHTGVAYTLFFSLYEHMKSVEIVSYSYLEPLFGILINVIFVGEILTMPQIIGGILILGSTFIGEVIKNKHTLSESIH